MLDRTIEQVVGSLFGDAVPAWMARARVADSEPLMRGTINADVMLAGGIRIVERGDINAQAPSLAALRPATGHVDVSFVSDEAAVRVATVVGSQAGAARNDMFAVRVDIWSDRGDSSSVSGWDGRHWHRGARELAGLASAIHLGRSDYWRVIVARAGGAPAVSFATDALGVSESFKLREAPSPTKRRTALLHWVAEHWRKKRDEPGALVSVREHLRGASEFTWNEWRCKIRPSRVDVARLGSLGARFVESVK